MSYFDMGRFSGPDFEPSVVIPKGVPKGTLLVGPPPDLQASRKVVGELMQLEEIQRYGPLTKALEERRQELGRHFVVIRMDVEEDSGAA